VQQPAADFEGQIELRQAAWPTKDVKASQVLPVRLEWKSLSPSSGDYVLFAQLLDAEGRLRAQRDLPLNDESGPTNTWQSGHEAATLFGLMIPPGTPPAAYRLVLGLYNPADGKRLTSNGLDALDLGTVEVERSSMSPAAASSGMRYRPNLTFPETTLVGHDRYKKGFAHAPDTPLSPGDTLRLVSLWQARAQPSANWMTTARLLSPDGKTVAAVTTPLAQESYPTSQWAPGEVVRGEHDLVVPTTTAPGRYQLQIAVHGGDARSTGPWTDLGPVALQ
jgi:hypothetical protein